MAQTLLIEFSIYILITDVAAWRLSVVVFEYVASSILAICQRMRLCHTPGVTKATQNVPLLQTYIKKPMSLL